jgi:hypothetical protein
MKASQTEPFREEMCGEYGDFIRQGPELSRLLGASNHWTKEQTVSSVGSTMYRSAQMNVGMRDR